MIQTREILLPLEYTVKHQVNPRDLVEKKNNEKIEEMIFDIASVANANLTKVRKIIVYPVKFKAISLTSVFIFRYSQCEVRFPLKQTMFFED